MKSHRESVEHLINEGWEVRDEVVDTSDITTLLMMKVPDGGVVYLTVANGVSSRGIDNFREGLDNIFQRKPEVTGMNYAEHLRRAMMAILEGEFWARLLSSKICDSKIWKNKRV